MDLTWKKIRSKFFQVRSIIEIQNYEFYRFYVNFKLSYLCEFCFKFFDSKCEWYIRRMNFSKSQLLLTFGQHMLTKYCLKNARNVKKAFSEPKNGNEMAFLTHPRARWRAVSYIFEQLVDFRTQTHFELKNLKQNSQK